MLANTNSEGLTIKSSKSPNKHTRPCVCCQQSTFTKLFDSYDFDTGKKRFSLETCNNCHLTRSSPVLSQTELSAYYSKDYYGSSRQKFNPLVESWTIWSNNRLAKTILKSAQHSIGDKNKTPKVLDIGCGRANLLKAFRNHGCECHGVERSDFPDEPDLENITIYKQDFLDKEFNENSYDIIVIWHVLEHLTDPVRTIRKAQKLLKTDGSLIVAVPNFASYQRIIFGKHWFHLDLPRHTYHFDPNSLSTLFLNSGLRIKSFSTRSIDQSLFGFIQSAINFLSINPPNTLYSILKTSQSRPGYLIIGTQLILASLLSPFALFEYIISAIMRRGTCLTIQSSKHQSRGSD